MTSGAMAQTGAAETPGDGAEFRVLFVSGVAGGTREAILLCEAAGYQVLTRAIPERITPKNRLLLGRAPTR